MMVVWTIWNDKYDPPDLAMTQAISWWQEFIRVNSDTPFPHTSTLNSIKWLLSPSDRLKMNFDGA